MKLSINDKLCAGHGRCYSLAPELFSDDDSGYGQVLADGEVPEHLEELAREALAACPEGAITARG